SADVSTRLHVFPAEIPAPLRTGDAIQSGRPKGDECSGFPPFSRSGRWKRHGNGMEQDSVRTIGKAYYYRLAPTLDQEQALAMVSGAVARSTLSRWHSAAPGGDAGKANVPRPTSNRTSCRTSKRPARLWSSPFPGGAGFRAPSGPDVPGVLLAHSGGR